MMFEQKSNSKKWNRSRIFSVAGTLLIASSLFFTGWGIGNGKISFNSLKPSISNRSVTRELDYSSIDELYAEILQNYDGAIDVQKLIDGLKEGLAKATGDPYTEYFNDAASQEFDEALSGSFGGIGAELGKEEKNLVIIAPIAGTPADKAGLRAKDVIAAIDDEPTPDISVSAAVGKIRGEPGTTVKLTIIRGGTQRLDVTLTREQINIPSVKWEVKDGIGIISVARFWDDTGKLARQAAAEFKAASVKGVVLDLRDNPGGALSAAVDLSSLWLDKGQVVLREKRSEEVISTQTASGDPLFKGMKTVVLINEGSASASEIVAGALKDHQAAQVIGVKSYGKGSVQQVIELGSGGTVKITIARWYTPNDKNIDKEGIEPDKVVENTAEDIIADRDPQLDTAKAALK